MTNYDRIKSMSVEEMTSVILMLSERVKKYLNARTTLVKQWLLQDVSDENITKIEHNSLCETETYKGGE